MIRLTAAEARKMGADIPKQKSRKNGFDRECFLKACERHHIPHPKFEFKFHDERKWLFDICWPGHSVAVEIQGGIFTQGRHTRGPALLKEHEKLNMAACLGYRILYTTPKGIMTESFLQTIKTALW